jgi:hypothetical protein
MHRAHLQYAALIAGLACSTAQSADSPPVLNLPDSKVVVELKLVAPNQLTVSYSLPPSCQALPLRSPYGAAQLAELRSSWRATETCGKQIDGQIVRSDSACKQVTFNLTPTPTVMDRVYPPVFPIAGLGVYTHTGIFAPTDACGPITWRFSAPGGDIVFNGKPRGGNVLVDVADSERIAYSGVYLSDAPIPLNFTSALSPDLPMWVREGLQEAIKSVALSYREEFSALELVPPFVIASAVQNGGAPNDQADVSKGGIMRFASFNPPAQPARADLINLRGIVAHEFAHKLQPEALNQQSGDSGNLIHEGGAEYLRWTAMIRLGWLSQAEAAEQLSQALNNCLASIGAQPWQNVEERQYGKLPYDCGLAIHVLILATRQPPARHLSADELLESYYRQSADVPAGFAAVLECADAKDCTPRWTPRLISTKANFSSQIDALINSAHLAASVSDSPPKPLQAQIASIALMRLLEVDCSDSHGFYSRDNGFEIAMSPACKTFRDGMRVTQMNGVSITTDPLHAARSAISACRSRHHTTVGLSDGTTLPLACKAIPKAAAHFYKLNIERVLALLRRDSSLSFGEPTSH